MTRITALDVIDVRFPTSRGLDGSDAMNPEPDYSAAYVVVRTDDPAASRVLAAVHDRPRQRRRLRRDRALAPYLVGREVAALVADIGAFARVLDVGRPAALARAGEGRHAHGHRGRRQRAVGPPRRASKTARSGRCWCRSRPEEIVAQIDFTYIDDALSPAEALAILEAAARNKHERIDDLERDGFPAYTTSAGWLGYDDDKVERLAAASGERRLHDDQAEGRRRRASPTCGVSRSPVLPSERRPSWPSTRTNDGEWARRSSG